MEFEAYLVCICGMPCNDNEMVEIIMNQQSYTGCLLFQMCLSQTQDLIQCLHGRLYRYF